VLIDGLMAALWSLKRDEREAAIEVRPFEPLARTAANEVGEEGARLLSFLAPGGAGGDVRVIQP
jgi:hypothetical protein